MEVTPSHGWSQCARLTCGPIELIITLEVGPRIIHFGLENGPNEFAVVESDRGASGGNDYRFYGGHRLWIAPELPSTTMQPDNDPVDASEEDGWAIFSGRPDANQVRKEMRIQCEGATGAVRILHRIYNEGASTIRFAPWAITQLAPGGTAIFPQSDFIPHTERVLPVRSLALWGYTNMADPRWTWGEKVVRLRHDPARGAQKVGALVSQGYAAYANHGNVLLQRFAYLEGAEYPDFGSNFEVFTNQEMLELESLGPLADVAPGGFVEHAETWYLIGGEELPDGDCGEYLASLASSRPL